jgi:hypothetical protein
MRGLLVLMSFFWILVQVYLVSVKSFSGDEASSLALIKHSFNYLLNSNYIGDFNPPLYFIILKFWMSISSNEYFVRGLGSLLGLMFFWLVTYSFKRDYKAILLLLLMTSPVVSFSFFFLRPYGLLLLLTIALYALYFRDNIALRREVKYFLAFLIIIAGSWTSYLFFLFEGFILVSLLFRDKKFSLDMLTLILAGLAGFLSILNFLLEDLSALSTIQQMSHVSFVKLFAYNLGSLVFSDFGLFPVVLYLTALCLLCFFLLLNFKTVIFAFKNWRVYWSLVFILSVVSLVSLSGVPRAQYLIVVLVPLHIILYHFYQKKLFGFLLILLVFQFFGLYTWIANRKEYYSSPVFAIDYRKYRTVLNGSESILVYPSYNKVIFEYYFGHDLIVNDVFSVSHNSLANEMILWRENFRIDNELPHLESIMSLYENKLRLEAFEDTSLTLGKSYSFGELFLLSK